MQRRLRVQPIVLVAAPAYLATRGAPDQPEDLSYHDGLLANEIASTWRLHGDDGREIAVTPRFRMAADESMMLLGSARRLRAWASPLFPSRCAVTISKAARWCGCSPPGAPAR